MMLGRLLSFWDGIFQGFLKWKYCLGWGIWWVGQKHRLDNTNPSHSTFTNESQNRSWTYFPNMRKHVHPGTRESWTTFGAFVRMSHADWATQLKEWIWKTIRLSERLDPPNKRVDWLTVVFRRVLNLDLHKWLDKNPPLRLKRFQHTHTFLPLSSIWAPTC